MIFSPRTVEDGPEMESNQHLLVIWLAGGVGTRGSPWESLKAAFAIWTFQMSTRRGESFTEIHLGSQ